MEQFPDALDNAIARFEARTRVRQAQELKLQKAKEYMKRGAWDEACRTLKALWHEMTWREEGWWDIVEEVNWSLRTAATYTGDGSSIVAVDWELMNKTFPSKPGWRYDLSNALEGLDSVKSKPSVVIREQDVRSFLIATFAFEHGEGKVGEHCTCQLTVTSDACSGSSPITISEIKIVFTGGLKSIILHHKDVEGAGKERYFKVALSEGLNRPDSASSTEESSKRSQIFLGTHDLTFSPGESRTFEFGFVLREFGEAAAHSATFSIAADMFNLDYVVDFDHITPDVFWSRGMSKRRLVRLNPHAVNILPKPPKMDIKHLNRQDQYYTNEPLRIQLSITNGEDEDTIATLKVQVNGDQAPQAVLKLDDFSSEDDDEGGISGPEVSLGRITPSKSRLVTVEVSAAELPAVYDLVVDLSYTQISDLETPISRTTSIQLFVISPFESNFEFSPRYDPKQWPSFFTHLEEVESGNSSNEKTGDMAAIGLSQSWCLTARYASFATSPLYITGVYLEPLSLTGGITCQSFPHQDTVPSTDNPLTITPNTIEESRFQVSTQKLSLDDRRSASLDLLLCVKWRRTNDGILNTTKIPTPRFMVASSEPRVLLTCTTALLEKLPVLDLSYTIENPSMHFLTFGMVMQPSEDFAFSGMKSGTVQLVPLSRRTISLSVLPKVRGEWIRPVFVVRDRYFQKVLRVAPGEGCKADKEGVAIWVPAEEEEEEDEEDQ